MTTGLVSEKNCNIKNSTGLTFIEPCDNIHDLPLTWEEGVACYVEDEDMLYVSAGPMVWIPFFTRDQSIGGNSEDRL